jgi:hypothetical protein
MDKIRSNEGILTVGVKTTSGSKNVKTDIQTPATFFGKYLSHVFHGAI